jgi:hypothetical protein
LDEALGGGLPLGAVTEWGVPLGRGGRDVVLSWLTHLTRPHGANERGWALWIYSHADLTVYPPAWLARGVALSHVRFAQAARPLADLRPAFMEPLFKLIVLDGPRGLSGEECAFLARQARAHGQCILLLRDFFLGPSRGNVWAKLRLNCWYDDSSGRFRLQIVRGRAPRRLSLTSQDVLQLSLDDIRHDTLRGTEA